MTVLARDCRRCRTLPLHREKHRRDIARPRIALFTLGLFVGEAGCWALSHAPVPSDARPLTRRVYVYACSELSHKDLSDSSLAALWKCLDRDSSGFIDAGELSRFTKIGQPKTLTPAQLARISMRKQKSNVHELVRAETDKYVPRRRATQQHARM